MPMPVFEIACVAIIALTLAAMARARPPGELARDYLTLALAGWIGEQTCIALYEYYAYAPIWHGRLGHVPLLVPLIWPLVILSAREVASAIAPAAGRWSHALVGALVAFDASLVEVVAVRAGLWSWAEGGHLGVPIIGVLGWGFFAAAADAILQSDLPRRRAIALVLAPLAAHIQILAAWWGLFRWVLRGPLGDGSVAAILALGAAATALALRLRARGLGLGMDAAASRMIAAALFVALLATTAPGDARLWLHTAAVALPYLALTRLGGSGVSR